MSGEGKVITHNPVDRFLPPDRAPGRHRHPEEPAPVIPIRVGHGLQEGPPGSRMELNSTLLPFLTLHPRGKVKMEKEIQRGFETQMMAELLKSDHKPPTPRRQLGRGHVQMVEHTHLKTSKGDLDPHLTDDP